VSDLLPPRGRRGQALRSLRVSFAAFLTFAREPLAVPRVSLAVAWCLAAAILARGAPPSRLRRPCRPAGGVHSHVAAGLLSPPPPPKHYGRADRAARQTAASTCISGAARAPRCG
jgi:hypothetical protein